jgi:hypothetical protein
MNWKTTQSSSSKATTGLRIEILVHYVRQHDLWKKNLLTVGVLACISHRKSARSSVLELAEVDVRVEDMIAITKYLQVLILETVTVNRLKDLRK